MSSYGLYIKETDERIGTLNKEQLQNLMELFEEEATDDQDYFVDKDTLEFMRDNDADEDLIDLLAKHVAEEGTEFEWRED